MMNIRNAIKRWLAATMACMPGALAAQEAVQPAVGNAADRVVCRAIVVEVRRADEMLARVAESMKSAPSEAEVRACRALRKIGRAHV